MNCFGFPDVNCSQKKARTLQLCDIFRKTHDLELSRPKIKSSSGTNYPSFLKSNSDISNLGLIISCKGFIRIRDNICKMFGTWYAFAKWDPILSLRHEERDKNFSPNSNTDTVQFWQTQDIWRLPDPSMILWRCPQHYHISKESNVLRTCGGSFGKMHSHMSLSFLLGTAEHCDLIEET